jgi:hypothetical protein
VSGEGAACGRPGRRQSYAALELKVLVRQQEMFAALEQSDSVQGREGAANTGALSPLIQVSSSSEGS